MHDLYEDGTLETDMRSLTQALQHMWRDGADFGCMQTEPKQQQQHQQQQHTADSGRHRHITSRQVFMLWKEWASGEGLQVVAAGVPNLRKDWAFGRVLQSSTQR